jgi:hypothetical protein
MRFTSQPAVPALLELTHDQHANVAQAAQDALRSIDRDESLRKIYQQIPAGMSIADAQRVLKGQGYRIAGQSNEPCLSCDKSIMLGWFVSRRYRVVVYYRDSRVIRVEARSDVIGP